MSTNLMRMRLLIRIAWLTVLIAATASCGDVVRTGRAPVMLSVTQLAPSIVDVSVSAASDVTGAATLAVVMKDVTSITSPTTNNDVTLTQYQVVYRRTDGRNTPGTDVPFPFSAAATLQILANGTAGLNFELVRQVAKQEVPLVQITDSNVVTMIAQVTFFGRDQVGNELSATASTTINFRK
jgi:hypothetical protein